MNRLISPGMYTLLLTLSAGAWISIAPFVMQTQPDTSAWSTATINDVVAGGILVGVSLVGICSHLIFALRDLVCHGPDAQAQRQAQRGV